MTPIHTPRTLQQCLDKAPQFRRTCIALALGAGMALSGINSFSMGLGRVTVQSALGEPLKAQIEITELTSDEASSLQVRLASGDIYKASGVDFNPILMGLKIATERRADGRAFLRISTDRVVNDPFVDLIIETQWASGRLVRDYTLLFDPPQNKPASPNASPTSTSAAVVAAQLPAVPAAAPQTTVTVQVATPASRPAQRLEAPQKAANTAGTAFPAQVDNKSSGTSGNSQQISVQPGDTAGSIARAVKPAEVSLDQMLVALLQNNPDAFIGGNVNRLKSGSVLSVPNAEQIASTGTPSNARSRIIAQSQDFNAFRRKLADVVPTERQAQDQRQSVGKIEAQAAEKKSASTAPDKLTLSKSTSTTPDPAAAKSEELIKKQAATRSAEINKNIADLSKAAALAGVAASAPASGAVPGLPASATPGGSTAAAAAPGPGIGIPANTIPIPSQAALDAAKIASAPAAASAPATVTASAPAATAPPLSETAVTAPASAPAVMPAKSVPTVTQAAQAESSFLDELLDNPLLPAAAIALLGALGALGWTRVRKGKSQQGSGDSSFLDSKLQPDSFFGASGGQNIDTNESGSSILYSPSQLDAAGDVDPVAEADVYLAYGRDLQAEEILKESLRMYPGRLPVMVKLAEIYAKRRDVKALEVLAGETFAITRGQGAEWQKVTEYGQAIDAANPLYKPGGEPAAKTPAMQVNADQAARELLSPSTVPQAARPELDPSPLAMDLDLDLDFSSDPANQPVSLQPVPTAEPTVAIRAMVPPASTPAQPPVSVASLAESPDLDFDMPEFGASPEPLAVTTAPVTQPVDDHLLDFDFDSNFPSVSTQQAPASEQPAKPAPSPQPMAVQAAAAPPLGSVIEFDLDDLSLDLDAPADHHGVDLSLDIGMESPLQSVSATPPVNVDPVGDADANGWSTKLELAEEFHAIGDDEGARGLAEEVFEVASGDLKRKAERLLSQLS